MIHPHPGPASQPRRPRRRALIAALALGSVLLVAAAPAFAQDATAPTAATASAAPATDAAAGSGIDGTWTLDREIGDFSDYSSSWVGFRVAEVLQGIGDVEAVGRTPVVTGSLTAEGSTITSAAIEVDLTTITSDQPRRDPAIQRALNTIDFPNATLTTREPVDLSAVPVDGEPFTASLPATLTIHGVSQDVDVELTGQRVGDVVVVVGTLPVDFTSFGITMPAAPIVLSVEDSGDLEWQLFFRLDAAATTGPDASPGS